MKKPIIIILLFVIAVPVIAAIFLLERSPEAAGDSPSSASPSDPKVLHRPSAADLKPLLKRADLALHIVTTEEPIVIRDAYLAEIDEAKGLVRVPRGYGDLQLQIAEIARLDAADDEPRPITDHWVIPGSSGEPKSYTLATLSRGNIGGEYSTMEDARSLLDHPKVEDLLVRVKLTSSLDREGLLACGVFSVSCQQNERAMEPSEKLTNLEMLRGLPVKGINLYGATELKDCSALAEMPQLDVVAIDAPGRVIALPKLAGAKKLRWLSLNFRLKNPLALEGMASLKHLRISGTGESDALDLPALPSVEELHLHDGNFADISAVKMTPNIDTLWLPASATQLAPLKALDKLEKLRLYGQGTDFSSLAEVPSLQELTVIEGQVDLAKLAGFPIKALKLMDVETDLSALNDFDSLEDLYLKSATLAKGKAPKTSELKKLIKVELIASRRNPGSLPAIDEMFDGSASIEQITIHNQLVDSLDRFLAYPALKSLTVKFADKDVGKRMAAEFNEKRPLVKVTIR